MRYEELHDEFKVYWDEMALCRNLGAYWSLLHVTVCLPDICAALQSSNGETNGGRYEKWCDVYLKDPMLNGSERWDMRCRVLHQGRSALKVKTRYSGFSFAQPSKPNGKVDHKRIESGSETLILDVGELSKEMEEGVESWIRHLADHPECKEAQNAAKNRLSLVKVRQFNYPRDSTLPLISTLDIVSRTS